SDPKLADTVAAVVDALQNRLKFFGPFERDGKRYVFGSYQGDEARVNFAVQFAKSLSPSQFVSADFRNALKAAMGTVRSESAFQGDNAYTVMAFACANVLNGGR